MYTKFIFTVWEVLRNINDLTILPPFGNMPKKFDLVQLASFPSLFFRLCLV